MTVSQGMARATAIAAAAAICGGLSGCTRQAPADTSAAAPVPVRVQPVRTQTLHENLDAPGTVVPASAADLSVVAPEACTVAELPQAEGTAVQAGDVLVRFDIASVQADVTDKQQALDEARLRLDAARQELAKQTSLLAQAVVPKSAVDAAAASVASGEAALTHAQALVKAASTLAGRAVVRAPFTGVVLRVFHAAGDPVRASNDDPVLRFVDPTRVQIAVQVTPGQLVRIIAGEDATVMDPTSGAPAPATVVGLPRLIGTSTEPVPIRLGLVTPALLALDTVVQTEIVLGVHEGALVVPTGAIQHSDATAFVFVAGPDGKAQRRDVHVGIAAGPVTEILSGVAAGDAIIVSPLDQVSDGARIQIDG